MLVTALVLALNLTDGLARAVPGYTGALQKRIEGNSTATRALAGVTGKATGGALSNGTPARSTLQQRGPVPRFVGISR